MHTRFSARSHSDRYPIHSQLPSYTNARPAEDLAPAHTREVAMSEFRWRDRTAPFAAFLVLTFGMLATAQSFGAVVSGVRFEKPFVGSMGISRTTADIMREAALEPPPSGKVI